MKTFVLSLADDLMAPLDLQISQTLLKKFFSFKNLILGKIHISEEILLAYTLTI